MFIQLDLYGKLFLTLWYLFWSTHSIRDGRTRNLGERYKAVLLLLYYQAILYIFLMIHCLLWKCIFYCNYFQNALLVANMEKWHRSHDITGWNLSGHACGECVLKYLIKYLLVQNIAPTSACVCGGGVGGWLGWLGGRLRWECAGVRTLRSALQICKLSIVLN